MFAFVVAPVLQSQFSATVDCESLGYSKCCQCSWVYQQPYVDSDNVPFSFCWSEESPCSEYGYPDMTGGKADDTSIECNGGDGISTVLTSLFVAVAITAVDKML